MNQKPVVTGPESEYDDLILFIDSFKEIIRLKSHLIRWMKK